VRVRGSEPQTTVGFMNVLNYVILMTGLGNGLVRCNV